LSDIAFGFEKPYEQNDRLIAQNVRLVATSLLILLTPLAWRRPKNMMIHHMQF